MYYLKQSFNPNKHPLMPDDYPWFISDTASANFIEITEEDYDLLVASFDLTEYNNATDITLIAPKIYSFMLPNKIYDLTQPPIDVDYVTGLTIKLHRKSTLVKGECVKEEFYEDYNGTVYNNLIVKEEHSFTRDAMGFAQKRQTVITWYRKNDTPHLTTKTLTKWYNFTEQIDEGKIRRGNLLNGLQRPILGYISLHMYGNLNGGLEALLAGRDFLATYKFELDTFVSDSNKTFIECLSNPEHPNYAQDVDFPWLTQMTPAGITVRGYLAAEFNI